MKASLLLSRPQTAALLATEEADVGRHHGHGLNPTKAKDGGIRYEPGHVRQLIMAEARPETAVVSGEVTAEAFKLFQKPMPLPDVAIALRLAAPTVIALREQFDRLAGTLSLGRETVRQLEAALGMRLRSPAAIASLAESLTEQAVSPARTGPLQSAPEVEAAHVIDAVTGKPRPLTEQEAEEGLSAARAAWARATAPAQPGPSPVVNVGQEALEVAPSEPAPGERPAGAPASGTTVTKAN